MTDTNLDRMVEQAAADAWEAENTPAIDPETARTAAAEIEKIIASLDAAMDHSFCACTILRHTNLEDRIASFYDGWESAMDELRGMKKSLEGGRR